jgi:hypothetical protein
MENFNEDILIDKEGSQFDKIEAERIQEEKLNWLAKEKLANLNKELDYCEGDLGKLGWDPADPNGIPADLDGERKKTYDYLINMRAGLLDQKMDLLEDKDSQEN